MNVCTLHGPRRWWAVMGVFWRVAWLGLRRLGPLRLLGELGTYLLDNRNMLVGSADRYVQRDGEIWAASAFPAISSPRFASYLLEEVTRFNARQPAPMVFALLSVSSRCPYRCRHCYALSELHEDEQVPIETIEAAVRGLAARGVGNIFFTGGEPMFRAAELPAVMARTASEVDAFWLVSTGWCMSCAALEPMLPHKLKGVVISLDSRHEAQVNKSKGSPQAWDNALAGIAAARELGLLVSVDCMVGDALLEREEFFATLAFLRDLGVHFVNFFPPHRIGGVESFDLPTLSAAQVLQLEALMDEVNKGRRYRDWPIAYSAVVWERRRGCSGGLQFVYVDPEGSLRPCPFLKAPAGNIRDTPVEQIIDQLRRLGERGGCYAQYEGIEKGSRTRAP